MAEQITIQELDWESLNGKTITVTIKVLNNTAYVVEGHQVHVVNLGAGKISEELPFFGPRSVRTGKLTEEQQQAMDLLIREGYTVHRAAMLLGVHDSTVQSRKKQLRSGTIRPRAIEGRSSGPTSPLSEAEIQTIAKLWFEQSKTITYIAQVVSRAQSTVSRYIRELEEGAHGGHPLSLANTSKVIEHQQEPVTNGVH